MAIEKYLVIKFQNEFFTKNTNLRYKELTEKINNEFPNSSYFIIDDYFLYQISKGFEKIFDRNQIKLDVDIALYYLHDKYNDFFNEFKILTNNFENIFYDKILYSDNADIELYDKNFEDLKEKLDKPIIIDSWKYKLRYHDIRRGINIDPTKNQKYLNWILKLMYSGFNYNEDRDKLNQLLIDFDKPQVKALIKNSGNSIDIRDYNSDKELFSIINDVYYIKLEELELKNKDILIEKRIIIHNEDWIIVSPKTHEEAVKLGRGTYWCTSADSKEGKYNFNYYTKNDDEVFYPLYIFINKKDITKKYQYSTKTQDFLDWNDEEFTLSKTFDIDIISQVVNKLQSINFNYTKFIDLLSINGIFFKNDLDNLIHIDGTSTPNSTKILNFIEKTRNGFVNKTKFFNETITYQDALNAIYDLPPLQFRFFSEDLTKEEIKNYWFKLNTEKGITKKDIKDLKNKFEIISSWGIDMNYLNKLEMFYFYVYSEDPELMYCFLNEISKAIKYIERYDKRKDCNIVKKYIQNIFNDIDIINFIENHTKIYLNNLIDEDEPSIINFQKILISFDYKLDYFFTLNNFHLNIEIIKQGYKLDYFASHENKDYRLETIDVGYVNKDINHDETNEEVLRSLRTLMYYVVSGAKKPIVNKYGFTINY